MTDTPRKRGRPQVNHSGYDHIGAVIRKYRLAAQLEQKDVAERLGYTKSSVGNWETGVTRPDVLVIPKLCRMLGIPLYELFDMEPDGLLPSRDAHVLSVFRGLDSYNQRETLRHMEQLLSDQELRRFAMLRQHYARLKYIDALRPAAGVGSPLPDYAEADTAYVPAGRAARASDLLLKVNGDSMSPDYPDRSLVFVRLQDEVPLGEVGVFIVDGELFIKERRAECLRSRNRAFADIRFSDGMDVRAFGVVTGVCDENSVLTGDTLNEVRMAFEMEDEG